MITKPSVLSIALLNTIEHADVFSSSTRDCTFSHVSCSAWTRDVKSSPTHDPFDSCEWCSCYDCSDHMVRSSHQDLVRASCVHAACALLEDVHVRHVACACNYKGALQDKNSARLGAKPEMGGSEATHVEKLPPPLNCAQAQNQLQRALGHGATAIARRRWRGQ